MKLYSQMHDDIEENSEGDLVKVKELREWLKAFPGGRLKPFQKSMILDSSLCLAPEDARVIWDTRGLKSVSLHVGVSWT